MTGALAIVPARDVRSAKTRLAPVLSPDARERLARRMLTHVVATLRASPGIGGVVVATDAPAMAELATSLGASALLDPPVSSLTLAVRAALSRLTPEVPRVVCMADLPWLTEADVGGVLAIATRGHVALAPDHQEAGTSVLALPTHAEMLTWFGVPGSLALHRAAAPAPVEEWRSLGTARDLDTPDDWARWGLAAV